MQTDPVFDLAHIGHVELFTPTFEESLKFFQQVMGLEEEARSGSSVYLRGYGDYLRYSLKLTEGPQAGLGHLALRARSQAALERRVKAIEQAGRGIGWIDGDVGHGAAFQFTDPDGHRMEIYFETEKYKAPERLIPAVKNRPQKYEGKGVGARRVDHINLFARDIRANRLFAQQCLGYKLCDLVLDDQNSETQAFMTLSIAPLELVYALDKAESPGGRLHHLAMWVDSREEILQAADIFLDAHVMIEVPPAKHTIGSSFFLYGREPGGNRIEVTTGVDFLYEPDLEPRVWTAEERKRGIGWGIKYPESWHCYGTPPLAVPAK